MGRQLGWEHAESMAQEAMLRFPNDVGILVATATVKQNLGKTNEAARWLVDASRVDRFQTEPLVLQAVAGLMSTGQLFEAIDLLDDVVKKHPDRKETRRWLFDCLVNSEQTERALPHGRTLIRQRHFDSVLLFSMGQNEQRDREIQSLTVLWKRNPDDSRLSIGQARVFLDQGKFNQAGELLQEILKQYPSFAPAWCIESERLFLDGQFTALETHLRETPESVKRESWMHWATVGDLAMQSEQPAVAARAYWEAIQRNAGVGKVHAKFARTLKIVGDNHAWITPTLLSELSRSAELLERLVQEKDRYYRSQMKSTEIAISIADLLDQLGHHWEAEAWLANAIRESGVDTPQATELREKVVSKLRSDLPWQAKQHAFETIRSQADISFPMTLFSSLSQQSLQKATSPGVPQSPITAATSATFRVVDESEAFGLKGATNQPIRLANGMIPIYSQLGSGGASLDYDLDGWPDVFVAGTTQSVNGNGLSTSNLYRNEASQLRPVRVVAGLMNRGFAQGTVTGDLNADGFVDLVQLNYGTNQVFLTNGDGTFAEAPEWFDVNPNAWSTSGAIADLDRDGLADMVVLRYCVPEAPLQRRCRRPSGELEYCAPTHFSADIDHFYRGKPRGGFQNVTEEWNAIPRNPGRGLGVVVGQLDSSASLDVFVANDMTSNHFWSQSPTDASTWIESGTLCGLALDWRSRPQASMGIATADFDGDQDLDFYVTNFEEEHNTLYLQKSSGIWSDQTRPAGLYGPSVDGLAFGTVAVDLDNDASQEVMVCNGHVHHDSLSGYAQSPQLWTTSQNRFAFLSNDGLTPYFQSKHVGRAVWKVDINRDRNIDLIVTHQGDSARVLCNRTQSTKRNRAVAFRLVGTDSSRDAIGSVITVRAGDQTQSKWLVAGDGYMSSSDKTLLFGLGPIASDVLIDATITWPNGQQQSIQTFPDRDVLVVQKQSDAFILASDQRVSIP
ncbi:MAG: FG-GAP-like repeat-containing protein [Rhodopirellula sp. JB055]|uniref:FG-GAP-like repeat-containing protein n=1 Tax=Rhodopirellula sp. JB055 TaxID=3342846 RepID=UPI00370A8415